MISFQRRFLAFALTFIFLFSAGACFAAGMDAKAIVKKSDDLVRGLKSFSKIKMDIERPEWSRSMTMEAWTQGTKNSFVRVLSPAKEKGITFLKKGREAWQYVPAMERVMKIPPSMMLQSWLGSDFTNDDLVKADSLVVDYTHKIDKEYEENGVKMWQITLTPLQNAAVVWGKVMLYIRQNDFVTSKCEYYNEDMELVKYFVTSNIKNVEGRAVPMTFAMINKKKPGHKTTMTYLELTFKPALTAATFSKANLKR